MIMADIHVYVLSTMHSLNPYSTVSPPLPLLPPPPTHTQTHTQAHAVIHNIDIERA